MSDLYNLIKTSKLNVWDKSNDLTFAVLVECPKLLEAKLPLVLISHGNGGSSLIYRTISRFLAKNGFIVAMVEHFGNNRLNNDLAESTLNLQYRPLHLSLTIDYLLASTQFAAFIDPNKIAVIGHSFGGYTALALAGGTPWTKSREKVEVHHDARIKVLVLMAPAAPFFLVPNALINVKIPILVYTASNDSILPKALTADPILDGVPDKSQVIHREIENAGHFSFISPFPKELNSPNFPPSIDPEGFDREAFHKLLPVEILEFLQAKLK